MIVVTTNDVPGHRIVRTVGLVRGITVRSRSVIGTIGGALQSLVGGNVTLFTQLAETSRKEALDLMVEHASQMGANAVIGMRYDSNEIGEGITEMLAYGTAVVIEESSPS
ncbi:MAG TPA: heavy metal-binding domain-containing protein [Devosia sp.]|nr:heavy metal-binding domain-containing protein [Devosia sp.]